MVKPIGYYSQSLSDTLEPKYGAYLELLSQTEKLQLVNQITAWMVACSEQSETDWLSLGHYVAMHQIADEKQRIWLIMQQECDFDQPRAAIPLLKAILEQLDWGIWLKAVESQIII